MILCEVCGNFYEAERKRFHLISDIHNDNNNSYYYSPIVLTESAAKCRLQTYLIENPRGIIDLKAYLDWTAPFLKECINFTFACFKVNILVTCMYTKNDVQELRTFKTSNQPVFIGTDLDSFLEKKFQKIIREREEMEDKGSGWSHFYPVSVELRKNAYLPVGLEECDDNTTLY